MNVSLLHKDELGALVAALLARYRVIAPVVRDAELRFDVVTRPEEVVLDYRNTAKPPKAALLPQVERLIRYQQQRDRYNAVQVARQDTTPTVILGIRPCDMHSVLLLDAVFGQGQFVDPYYQARRANTLLFALACDRPRPACFCHALGSGPYDPEGADVLLREAGEAYLVEAVSARGASALADLGLPEASAADMERAREIEAAANARLPQVESLEGIEQGLASLFDSDLWREISEGCLACGACTYQCPTCHCFNIEDRVAQQGGERVRAWDSCQYSVFTAHASGHNPRPDQAARWRQRAMHKFAYLPRNVGLYGCVGCGRCVAACPVHLDIREIMRRVRQKGQATAEAGAQEQT